MSRTYLELREGILVLPQQIHEQEHNLIDFSTRLIEAEQNLKQKEADTYLEVSNAMDADGKPVYSNEIKRNIAVKSRLDNSPGTQELKKEILNLRKSASDNKIILDTMKRKFRAYESILKST